MLLRIRLDDPGWFANSPRLVVTVDGQSVFDGSFRGGFVCSIEVGPGTHTIETAIAMGLGLSQKRQFQIAMPAPAGDGGQAVGVEASLQYNRLLGNFATKLDVKRIDGAAEQRSPR
jgi:hypothetical protein